MSNESPITILEDGADPMPAPFAITAPEPIEIEPPITTARFDDFAAAMMPRLSPSDRR